LTSGERLLIEHLAERLGVSPTPVREALACLIQEGMVLKTPEGKLQVVPLTHAYVVDVFLVRGALEGLATELAATRIKEEALAQLAEVLEQTTAALEHDAFGPYMEADALSHRTVALAAGSALLSRELETLQSHIAYVRGYAQRHGGDHMRASHHEHQCIYQALARRDADAARRSMEQHIRNSGERIARLIAYEKGGGATR